MPIGYLLTIALVASRPSIPFAYVRPDAPPFFVAHGDHVTYVPVEGARHFQATLRQVSSLPVVYAELPGAQHSFDLFHSIRFETLIDGIEAVAAWVRSTNGRCIAETGHTVNESVDEALSACPARRGSDAEPCEGS
jgi:acetyl esterase/lipase